MYNALSFKSVIICTCTNDFDSPGLKYSHLFQLGEFDVLEIPKRAKISYFLAPPFFHAVLKYLMAFNEDDLTETSSFNKEIEATKKSSLEKFLDIISIEFNKHSKFGDEYDDNPDNEQHDLGGVSEKSGSSSKGTNDKNKSATDSTIFQVDILNLFLTQIDVEILTAWKSDDFNSAEEKSFGHQSTRKKLMDEANKLIWGTNKDSSYDEEVNRTLRNDTTLYKKKVLHRNDYLMQKKVSSELYDLGITDILDLINQLYLYMSVILCIGILGKRAAWGITQLNYLDNRSKLILKAWCKNEAKMKEFDLQVDEKEDLADAENKGNIASTGSLNLQSSNLNYIMGNAGWMNVSDSNDAELNCNSKILKKCEEFIARNELVESQNIKLLAANEELKIKIQSLYDAIESLTRDSSNELQIKVMSQCNEEEANKADVSNKDVSENQMRNQYIEENEQEVIEMKEQYLSMIENLKIKLIESQNKNYDLKEEIKYLELKNVDIKQDKDLVIAKLDAEKLYFENLHYISCLDAGNEKKVEEEDSKRKGEKPKKVDKSSSSVAVLLLAKTLIKKQNEYQESVDEMKNEIVLFSSKYEILKSFTKKIRERNLQYSLAVNEMLENDRKVWEWVMGLKLRIKKVEAQIGKMRDKVNEVLTMTGVSPDVAREVESLRRSINYGLNDMKGYLWRGEQGSRTSGVEEIGRVDTAENGVEAENDLSRGDIHVRCESEETRIVK
ncbi:hypothetical protein PMKS-002669 [Pichia membranifaciens]|uniref:Uncharacterized protein n=1 Tax=Pichia membranifaciens TaxID=4926 RepID=A0A1Q2YI21_9ASCO|nr:hypothetical protein PMKS-002669 [Pichia membranifaciens]